MRKTFCDKCGKEITEDVEWVFNHELCPECAEAVDIFIAHRHMSCTLCGNNCQVSPFDKTEELIRIFGTLCDYMVDNGGCDAFCPYAETKDTEDECEAWRTVQKIRQETDIKLTFRACTLCGNNCQVSPLEQFNVRNELCKEREQMYRRNEND